jgi:hypothetical protein
MNPRPVHSVELIDREPVDLPKTEFLALHVSGPPWSLPTIISSG